MRKEEGGKVLLSLAPTLLFATAAIPFAGAQQTPTPVFNPGNLVVTVEGCGVQNGTCTSVPNSTGQNGGYGDNQAGPLTLFQYAPNGAASATFVNSLVLPQTGLGANFPVSGEYGSSSEGMLQLAGSGQYLTLMGYGINANTFNANPNAYSAAANSALAQSGSLTGQGYTPVARVLALIDAYGNVNSTTALYNIFSTNNPRSAYSLDGRTNFYVSGQGSGSDATGGVFFSPIGAVNNAPTAITGLDTSSKTIAQDTRDVQIYNNTLYVSVDTKEGSGNTRDFIGTLGNPPVTGLYSSGAGPTQITSANNAATPVAVSSNGKITLTASETNGINSAGQQVNLSPVIYFFANPYTLYVTDSGNSKQTSATSPYGDGGLQKWINTKTNGTGTWQLAYTLSSGLNLVANPTANASNTDGATGLYGLAGVVSGNNVYLYVTNYNIADLDPTYLYGIVDSLSATTNPGESFTQLAAAPADSNFKGVSFAPSLPTGSATITSSPSGVSFTTSGTGCTPGSYTTPFTLIWTPGSSCQLSVANSAIVSGTKYAFSNWGDGTASPTDSVTAPSTSAVYTANFTTNYKPLGNLDEAVDSVSGTTIVPQNDSVYISGWASDPVDGAPLGSAKVYIDGASVTAPKLGISRPDVAAANKNAAYTNSGFLLQYPTSSLSVGPHTVTASATDSAGLTAWFETLTINVVAASKPPVGNFDLAVDNATATQPVHQSDLVYMQGWAGDYQANGSVATVSIVIDGTPVGNATLGQSRPDVAAYYSNPAWANTGWVYSLSAANLSLGTHTITATAADHNGLVTWFNTLNITVAP